MSVAFRAHRMLADYVRIPDFDRLDDRQNMPDRFASMMMLGALFVPFFAVEFANTGFPAASLAMGVAGIGMLSSIWILRIFRSLSLARDVFLGTLFLFLLWEAYYFGTIYSPGTVWLVAMPVGSILLGCKRAGITWLVVVLLAVAGAYLLLDSSSQALVAATGRFGLLYSISVASMTFAIFLFVLMVDASRAQAFRDLEQASAAIRELAAHDELSGLLNRRAFHAELERQVGARSDAEAIAVLVADLDGFKDVNDTYGHDIGDGLIRAVTADLRRIVDHRGAVLARLGGDEFAVLVAGQDAGKSAAALAEDIRECLSATPFDIDGRSASVGISIGLAVVARNVDASEIVRRADVAMYEAKRRGKNQLFRYEEFLDIRRGKRLALAAELAEAVDARAIAVHYQPIVDSATGRIEAVEALARWNGPGGADIPPEEFVAVAEEAGLINRLGLHVLDLACRQASGWPGIKLSVNLSPLQLRSPTLVQDIGAILQRSGLPAEDLELEVTEGYLIDHRDYTRPLIDTLHAAGVRIALDDFGTGYSSIGYLREYRFDRLKIDKSLVRGIVDDPAAQSIIQATVILAQSLGLDLTAEGVETEEQARLLRLAGCGNLQGYWFGRPLDAAAMGRRLASQAAEEIRRPADETAGAAR